ncbi:hypothetical protein MSG28_015433 [Choristoneura fumiferana]|uniref:Uncharacterized protein n=1 Tax=Choristoneura fumiferana TaxID=7141 RepID=A0ACC0KAB1_CHOFU|nr:hypothetical protein MSG28_015433 [Choristoneura fumiferana]
MEAVVFNGKELTLKYVKNLPIPKVVDDTDVIIKVEYSGICGTDVHIIQVERIIMDLKDDCAASSDGFSNKMLNRFKHIPVTKYLNFPEMSS